MSKLLIPLLYREIGRILLNLFGCNLCFSWTSKIYQALLLSVLQLMVLFEKRWIHLVGSVVANYAQPIRPICLVMALQGPRASILPLNPRSNKKTMKE